MPCVAYTHVESLVDLKRHLIENVTGGATAQSASRCLRQLGRALEELASAEPRAAFLLLLSTAEELRQVMRGTDEHRALLESALATPDAALPDLIDNVEAALIAMLEGRPPRPVSERIRTLLEVIER